MQVKITGKIYGARKIAAMFHYAPEVMTATVRRWFYSIRKKFVGKKGGKAGSYVRWLMRRKLKGRPGTWSKQAAGMFKGFVKARNRLEAMALVMGIPQQHQSGFVRGIEGRQAGGYPITSSKFMPVPIIDRLAAMGITDRYYKHFTGMIDSDEIVSIREGGKVLYVHQPTIEEGGDIYDATVYVGAKRVNIPGFDFQFESKFMRILPREIEYGQKRIDRTIRGLEKGYIKPK